MGVGTSAKPALGWATEGRGSWRDSQDLAFSHPGLGGACLGRVGRGLGEGLT